MSDPQNTEPNQDDETLGDEELEQPSTTYDPGEEPTSDENAEPEIDAHPPADDEPSHEAVGIGVVGRPQVEPEAEGGSRLPPHRRRRDDDRMAKYLISFPSGVMDLPPGGLAEVSETSHAALREAKDAGVYVFGGGIDESVAPVVVDASGDVSSEVYPRTPSLNGGFLVLEVPSREEAVRWAARFAQACRCPQELQAFGHDPES